MKKRGTVRSLSFCLFLRPGKAEGHAHHGGKADWAASWTVVSTSSTTAAQAAPMSPVEAGRRP